MQRLTWDEICQRSAYHGCWVALESCVYDEETGETTEGLVVDFDGDLATLCHRVRQSERSGCAILFCDAAPLAEAARS